MILKNKLYNVEGVIIKSCLDNCYLYLEDESIEHLSPEDQIILEKELKKSKIGEEFDPTLILQINKKICLGGYLKKNNKLKQNCKHYWQCLEELSIEKRIQILDFRGNKKWKRITLSVSILMIIVSSFFAYLNFSKPTCTELKTKIEQYKKDITKYLLRIKKKR